MILIDMKMPESCEGCPLCHRVFNGNETRLACYGLGAYCFEDDGRLDNCPLHEVNADTDMVSRKAVFDAVKDLTKWSLLDRFDRHVGVGVKYYEVQEAVIALPPSPTPSRPSEPKIIHCKDCNHYIKHESYCEHLGINISDHDYCSYAKRKEGVRYDPD